MIQSTKSLRAGVAQTVIDPAPGTQLAGDVGVRRPAETFLDPLMAKAIVFESLGKRLCILALDVTIITRQYVDLIRDGAAARFGFERDALMIHATQTHSAPGVGGFLMDDDFLLGAEWDWVRFRDDAYAALVVEQSIEAIGLALANLQTAQFDVGSTEEGNLAFNRRGVGRDGHSFMPTPHRGPGNRWAQLRYLEGPIDPELGVTAIRDEAGNAMSLLLSYTCHPVHLFMEPKGIVSADWPGVWSREMNATCGSACIPVVLNGACGDINPWHPFDSSHSPNQEVMGCTLAKGAQRVLDAFGPVSKSDDSDVVIDWRVRHLKLPLRVVPPDELEAARQMLNENPEPFWREDCEGRLSWEWLQAALKMSVHLQREREGELDYEIQVFRVGNSAWVGLPGEPFASGGIEIKLNSKAEYTFIVHCTSQYVGYIPTRDAFPRGGHEVDLSYWAKLEPEALELIVAAAVELLGQMFP